MSEGTRPRVEIVEVTSEEIQQRIDGILAEYPWFTARYDSLTDCWSNEEWEIAQEYGDKAADAWRRYESWRWLLDGGRR